MAILEALGINSTAFIQLFIFIVTIFFLAQVVFKPYAQALESRSKRTIGGEEQASEVHQRVIELSRQYETRAREVSGQIKTIFDSYREEAVKEYESIVTKARSESQKMMDQARQKVSVEISEAAKKLKEEAPSIAQAITQKLLSNERSAV
jgi:F-type H+-transporting ATPase subunit b